MVFQCINIRQVPWEVLKTTAFGLGFQHLPRDLANVNAWKTMFDPYIIKQVCSRWHSKICYFSEKIRLDTSCLVDDLQEMSILIFPEKKKKKKNFKVSSTVVVISALILSTLCKMFSKPPGVKNEMSNPVY